MALVQAQSAQEVSPPRTLAWFHVPKCSTSIGTTFGHYLKPGLGEDLSMPACTSDDPCESDVPEIEFERRAGIDQLDSRIVWAKQGNWGDHSKIDEVAWWRFEGQFVGLFRDPLRRAWSAYKWFAEPVNVSEAEYARRIKGTTVRMMSGQRYGLDCNWPQYPCDAGPDQEPAHLQVATDRLRGFKFVGLTDEYPLSVCLFHARFGGECLPSEFENMRPTSAKTGQSHEEQAVALLGDVVDEEETTFFLSVYDRFCSDLNAFDVTHEACRTKICPRAREHFDDGPGGAKSCAVGRGAFEAWLRKGGVPPIPSSSAGAAMDSTS